MKKPVVCPSVRPVRRHERRTKGESAQGCVDILAEKGFSSAPQSMTDAEELKKIVVSDPGADPFTI